MFIQHERGPPVAHLRPARSAVSASWHHPGDAYAPPAQHPDHEVAAIISRAALIGVPAWRVATALGLPVAADAPDADARPPQ